MLNIKIIKRIWIGLFLTANSEVFKELLFFEERRLNPLQNITNQ
jgi:hypothetical protein